MVLNRASLAVAVSKEDEFLLLASPERAHTLTIQLKKRVEKTVITFEESHNFM